MYRYFLAILLIVWVAPEAIAQSGPMVYVPVDQTAADVDPSQKSLRQVGAGLRADGEHTSVFKAVPIGGGRLDPFNYPQYIKVAPGYRALVPHMDYSVLVNPYPRRRLKPQDIGYNVNPVYDGMFVELIPAGTVFDLRPVDFNVVRLAEDYDVLGAPSVDQRVSPRQDPRISTRLDPRIDPQAPPVANDVTRWYTGQPVDDAYLRTLREVKARQARQRAMRRAAPKQRTETEPAKDEQTAADHDADESPETDAADTDRDSEDRSPTPPDEVDEDLNDN